MNENGSREKFAEPLTDERPMKNARNSSNPRDKTFAILSGRKCKPARAQTEKGYLRILKVISPFLQLF